MLREPRMKGAGGGKRGGRKRASVEPDDRPRGYEATRMRQLWRDIDHAKRKAGLDPAPEPLAASTWDIAGMVERAATLAGDAAAWVTANAPAACALIASGAELLRGVPVVRRLVDLVPTPCTFSDRAGHERPVAPANGYANGSGRTGGGEAPVEPDQGEVHEPNGKWIH